MCIDFTLLEIALSSLQFVYDSRKSRSRKANDLCPASLFQIIKVLFNSWNDTKVCPSETKSNSTDLSKKITPILRPLRQK